MMKLVKTILASAVLVGANGVSAAGTDTAGQQICAATEVVGCVASGDCVRDTPDGFNLPVMFRLDPKNKKVTSVRAGGEQRESAIASVVHGDGFSLFQGVDGAAGWSVLVNPASGQMTVSSAHLGIAYSVFGTCVNL